MLSYIFDFNGTMVRDSYMHEAAWRAYVEVLCHRQVSEEEFKMHVHGKTSAMILEHFLGKGKLTKEEIVRYSEDKEAYYRNLCMENKERFHLIKGLETFLEESKGKGISMTIASAANLANMQFYFEYFELERWFDFDKVVYDDATLKGKPDPDIYLRAMDNIGAKPLDCVVFEDAVSGVVSASRAGAGKIIGVYADSDRRLLEATRVVDGFIKDFTKVEDIGFLLT